jgi:DNA-binding MarR family transcriptional regulator
VSSYVKRLDARGHVRRVANPADGRSYRLALTAAGRRAHLRAGLAFLPALQRVESALATPPARVQAVLRDLHHAVQAARGADA